MLARTLSACHNLMKYLRHLNICLWFKFYLQMSLVCACESSSIDFENKIKKKIEHESIHKHVNVVLHIF